MTLPVPSVFIPPAESVLSLYTAPILPFAQKFNLTLVAHNSTVLHTPKGLSGGTVTVGISDASVPLEVAPITPLGKGKAWEVFGWAARRAFVKEAEEGGKEMVLAPSGMTGNTSVLSPLLGLSLPLLPSASQCGRADLRLARRSVRTATRPITFVVRASPLLSLFPYHRLLSPHALTLSRHCV